jgi:hypothetical protein
MHVALVLSSRVVVVVVVGFCDLECGSQLLQVTLAGDGHPRTVWAQGDDAPVARPDVSISGDFLGGVVDPLPGLREGLCDQQSLVGQFPLLPPDVVPNNIPDKLHYDRSWAAGCHNVGHASPRRSQPVTAVHVFLSEGDAETITGEHDDCLHDVLVGTLSQAVHQQRSTSYSLRGMPRQSRANMTTVFMTFSSGRSVRPCTSKQLFLPYCSAASCWSAK